MTTPRILISNDDGIEAEGLQALAAALEPLGEVWVVAPNRERSAISHAISLHSPLRMRRHGERRFACDGTPTDCVYMGLHHVLDGRPDLVLSGINHGPNLGNDVLYSGTVSAAMEGALFGYSAMAFSLCLPENHNGASVQWHFDTATRVARELVTSVLEDGPMPAGVLLNVNVPNRPYSEIAGIKLCRLGYTDWSDSVTERADPRGKPYYWIGGERIGHDNIPDSDNNAIAAGCVTVTPVHYDLTDYRSFDYIRSLEVRGFDKVADALGSAPLPPPVHPRLNGRR